MRNINFIKTLFLVLFGSILSLNSSCSKDEPGDDPIEYLADGYYIKGSATGDKTLAIDTPQMVEPSSDFATKVGRAGMMYGIHYLSAGEIALSKVVDGNESSIGATDVTQVTQEEEAGEAFDYVAGTLAAGATDTYTVPSEGLYYIMTDENTSKFWVMKINNIEINVTGDKAELTSGSADAATFEAASVELRAKFKIRFNTAWKFVLEDVAWNEADAAGFADDHVRPVLSYGGTVDALTADGGDIEIVTDQLLNFSFNWVSGEKGIAGLTITTEDAGELPPPEFPDVLYMTGGSVGSGAWGWADGQYIEMIPVHSNPHLFYSIQWVDPEATDPGFKFSPELDWGPSFGIDLAAGETDGVYGKGGDNGTVAEAGYYSIVVNLETETIEINAPNIHGIGDAFGGWDAAQEATKFTVDNSAKVITSPSLVADANVRMHVAAATLTNADGNAVDWWQAEFNVIDGVIEYRGAGDDQAAVAGSTGQVVTLDFVNGTGTIQ
ncbi:MAG: SusF/SusE family outer membrane protein [Bacteroidota bacterium]